MKLKIFSLIAFAIAVSGVIYLYHNRNIFSDHPFAIAVQSFAAILMIWARFTFGVRSFNASANATKGNLVTHGPYRFWRHPIYAAVIYFFIGSLIAYPHLRVFIAVLVIAGGLFVRMILEEKSLSATYPEYESYCSKAKRIIPFVF